MIYKSLTQSHTTVDGLRCCTENDGPMRATLDDVDRYIGHRIRARRLVLGMTQRQLAAALDITYPQIQKYEAAVDRVSCNRLHYMALALDASPATFFPNRGGALTSAKDELGSLVDRPDTMRLLRAFGKVRGTQQREWVIEMIEDFATRRRVVAAKERGAAAQADESEWWRRIKTKT